MQPPNAATLDRALSPSGPPVSPGLPGLETMVLRHLGVPLASICLTRARASRMFLREGERLLYISQDIDDYLLSQPVAVKRSTGMKGCSLEWSLEMVVEHSITVGNTIGNTLRKLRTSPVPKPDRNIVHATPVGGQGPQIRKDLQDFLTRFLREFDDAALHPGKCANHPWFGRMNATQWFRLAAFNNLVHRLHAERIYDRLPHTNICA